ncbi:peroxiredoxin Q, chloroplastic-like isoform X2 [Mangifera indica]|uniref:peroxiredoxin Q, chloroplastic-like isoform X2 n=1 Tax=Mangifera indica TaxID=29780 RepID=UPI001CF931C9|nr:peroxiredoxin Q, chloroplastic-like isoform X2 [Mangifera indica]
MASLTFQNLSLPSSLPIQTIKTPSSSSFSILSKSSQSQFYGLTLSYSSSLSIPSSTSLKTSISAKVNKGQVPPAFTLKDQDGKNVSLSKFKGKPVVVYFYPADETPGCTKQEFAKKYRLPFTLLSDEGNKVRKDWGVPADLFGALPGRQTYVLDKNGVVQLIYNNQFQPEKHIDETLKLLQSL